MSTTAEKITGGVPMASFVTYRSLDACVGDVISAALVSLIELGVNWFLGKLLAKST